ncbi:class F sortase [Arthrobacter sp. zg-Y1110]|uniref:class F sortase n=1 Tax=Arthrobacter sp. zg-Y1110 TaxID=2886932 RepID=UPI0021AE85F4|nr:class F sortase [Arthrobacter sp. zg-Y1110]UWX85648.1 sortase [Arthrobacter sp. zg-Y1110]
MTASRPGRRAGLMSCAAAALLLLSGCSGTAAPETGAPTTTTTTAAAPAATAAASSQPAAPQADAPPVLSPSAPVSLSIPATGTESRLLHLGLREDGSLEVPPEPPGSPASWYTGSPTPGERGPAVLLGHVNATGGGEGVFAGLRNLSPGDRLEIAREDGSTAVFSVDRGEQYGKDEFPTLAVYGNTAGAELRLITCDGFDPATGTFDDNYVVYASLSR